MSESARVFFALWPAPGVQRALGDIARGRGVDEIDAVADYVVADRGETRILVTSMTDADVHEITRAPWVTVGSDGNALAVTGVTSQGKPHPRYYGTHAYVLGPCVRDLRLLTLEAAVAKLKPGERFVVATPDAEVEVKGTRFELVVDGETSRCEPVLRTRLTVQEGVVAVRHEGREVRIEFDALLVAVGRVANTQGYGLEELGIPVTKARTVETNEFLQTIYPNIYACGDVAGPYQFTHTAAHQAWYAAVNALFGGLRRFRADYSVIPWATFTDPEVARVGLNETEARERNIACEVTVYGIDELDRAIADEAAYGMVKVLTVPGKDRILGATIVGEHAGDLIAEFVAAMRHRLGLKKILATIHIYPTLAEANKYAAGAWRKAHAPEGVLRQVEKFHAWMRG